MTTKTLEAELPTPQKTSWRAFYKLTKPTITLSVIVTAVPAVFLASQTMPPLSLILAVLFGAGLMSASAAVFNQLVEGDIDSSMERTKNRSIPSGKVSTPYATAFGILLGVAGLIILSTYTTPVATLSALAGHLFYVFIYTMYLKPRTPQNIVIGGAAGSVGPLIGWAAVTGSLPLSAWVLFTIIFLWTPPHFWSLSLKYKDDYAKAGIPMYPVVYGDEKTRKAIMLYSYSLLPAIIALYFLNTAGMFFLIAGSLFTLKFIVDATKLYMDHNNQRAMPFFIYSCFYTFIIFGLLAAEKFTLLLF